MNNNSKLIEKTSPQDRSLVVVVSCKPKVIQGRLDSGQEKKSNEKNTRTILREKRCKF